VLARAYADWEAGRPLPSADPEVAARFDRTRAAQKLARVLDGAILSRSVAAGLPSSAPARV
jgi:hypothetical protein